MMSKFGMLLLVLFMSMNALGNMQAEDAFVERFDIEPNTFYELTFDATLEQGADEVKWAVHMLNGNGDLPYDGCLEGDWQTISPGEKTYSHAFLAPKEGAELQFKIRHHEDMPQVTDVNLRPIDPPNLVLNGDFSKGEANFSGWTETYNVDLIQKDGETALRVNLNGYALSDYFPVEANGGYKFIDGAKTWPGVSVLAYDRNKRLIDRVPNRRQEDPPIRMPSGAAYARLLFNTSHDHIPSHRTSIITRTGLEAVGDPPAEALEPDQAERASGEIILSPNSDAREERAAKELQYWVAEITGRTMPLLARPSSSENMKIHIGAAWADAFEDDLQYLEETDGYAVRRQANSIYVFGSKARGTLFGVYALLRENTDIIWPRPNPDFVAVFSKRQNIQFENADFRSRPAFASRQISNSYSMNESHVFQDWLVRNGLNAPHRLHRGLNYLRWQRGAQLGYGGSYLTWLGNPGEEDEQYYPLVDGERSISRWRQPCYTYPKTVETMVEAFRDRLDNLPGDEKEIEYLHATISDNWTVCACDQCMAPIDLGNGELLEPESQYANDDALFFSTRNFKMLNQVAEILSEEYPNLKIQTHAYIFTAEPPAVEIHPAIIPEFAAYPTQNSRYPIMAGEGRDISFYDREIWKRRFSQWGEKESDGLGFFGYYYAKGFNALADTAAEDYRDLHDLGGVQVHTEGYPVDGEELSYWDVDGIEKWVIARLMWDPQQDPAKLRQVYIEKVYREAAPQMARFYELIRASWRDAPRDVFVNCHVDARVLFEEFIVGPGLEKRARNLLVEAEKAAKHPASKRMIQRTLAHFDKLGESLGRRSVPYVEESTNEWDDPVSPHWEKALHLEGFKQVDDWRQFEGVEAANPTTVSVMHDGDNLYFRARASDADVENVVVPAESGAGRFPQGDRIEIVLRVDGRHVYYVAVGPNGNFYSHPDIGDGWQADAVTAEDAWVATVDIPLESLRWEAEEPTIEARFGRVYRLEGDERRESSLSGASIYNRHDSFWTNLLIE